MKKILIGMLTFFVIDAVIFCVFISVFDLDTLRPFVTQKISEATGQPVEIGRLSMHWKNGLLVRADNVAVFSDVEKKNKFVDLSEVGILMGPALLWDKKAAVPFEVTGLFYSSKPNLRLTGELLPPADGQKPVLRKLVLQSGLSDLDLKALQEAFPLLEALGVEGNLGGTLELRSDSVHLDENGAKDLQASVAWKNGAVQLGRLQSPIEKIQLSARLQSEDFLLENFTATFAGGSVRASASLRQFRTQGDLDFKFSAQDLVLNQIIPPSFDDTTRLQGHVSLDFAGQAKALQLMDTLSGQGHLLLKDGVLLNVNLFGKVMQKFSMIPGVEEAVANSLPDFYKAKLYEPNTVFKPVDLLFTVRGATVFFQNLVLATDLVSLTLSGQVTFDKNLISRGSVRLNQDLTIALVTAVPQLQLLTNSQGEIEVPLEIRGQLPHVSVTPDREYLTKKLLIYTTQEVLRSQIGGLLDSQTGGAGGLKNLLKRVNV